jgi:hypothetical protein
MNPEPHLAKQELTYIWIIWYSQISLQEFEAFCLRINSVSWRAERRRTDETVSPIQIA